MKRMSDSLTIRSFPVRELVYGGQNSVTAEGRMSVDPAAAERLAAEEELIHSIDIRIIRPDEHRQHTNTIMDVLPLATEVGDETNVLAENTITATDGRKGIALLKLKLRARRRGQ